MTHLNDIPVAVEFDDGEEAANLAISGRVLREIRALLAHLLDEGTTGTIDLRALPHMDEATYRHLRDTLGVGEVTASVDADVRVEVRETQYPGVWWLTHRNPDQTIVTELIQVTLIPDILKSHIAEIRAGLRRFDQTLPETAANEEATVHAA